MIQTLRLQARSRRLRLSLSTRDLVMIIIFATLCILPWRGGYFMLLDFVITPGMEPLGEVYRHTALLPLLTFLIRDLVHPMVYQYVIYMGGLIALGRGARTSLRALQISGYALTFGVIFAMCNPFIYTRMMEGHANVFVGYGLIFMALGYVIQLLYTDEKKISHRILWLIYILGGLAVSYFMHSIFIRGLVSLLILLISGSLRKRLMRRVSSIFVMLVINSNWIIAGILGVSAQGEVMKHFGTDHFRVFNAISPDANTPLHLATLHGFWGESMGRYINPFAFNDRRQYMFALIAVCVVVGIYVLYTRGVYDPAKVENNATDIATYTYIQKSRSFTIVLVIMGVIGYLLSMGGSGRGWVAELTSVMYEHIPFYHGLREPQKRTGVVLFCYVVLSSVGISHLLRYLGGVMKSEKRFIYAVGVGIAVLPILYTPTMLFALKGQLTTHYYPEDWMQAKEYLFDQLSEGEDGCDEETCYDVLMLPWHQYMVLSRGRNIVASPIPRYFSYMDGEKINVLAGDNMEMQDIYTQSSRPVSKIVEAYIGPGGSWKGEGTSESTYVDFVSDMKRWGVSFIVLFHEVKREGYLEHIQSMIEKDVIHTVLENDHLTIYELH